MRFDPHVGTRATPGTVKVDLRRIAADVLTRAGLPQGVDARALAVALGLRVCPVAAPTRIKANEMWLEEQHVERRTVLYYDDRLHPRDRDVRIWLALATRELDQRGNNTAENASALARLLGQPASAVMSRLG